MFTETIQKTSLEKLSFLPQYAQYILDHRLTEFVLHQLQLSKKLNLPLLKQLAHLPDEAIIEIAKDSSAEFLDYLAANKAKQQIEDSTKKWVSNQLPSIDKYSISAQDINIITYIRKQSFLHFIPAYCSDVNQVIELVKEIDLYCMHADMASTNTYIEILKENIEQHSHFIEKVNETVPGGLYVFDVVNFKNIYSNEKLADTIGYSPQELNEKNENAVDHLVHEDDRKEIKDSIERLKKAKDKEIISYRYRVLEKNGEFKWLCNYETVFKRNENGEVIQTIGIILDVDQEKKVAEALRENENLYKRAEAITHLGSYSWDIKTNKLKWSDELYRIYGLDPAADTISFEFVGSFNYPEDIAIVRKEYKEAIAQKKPFDFYYRIVSKDGQHKILHARGEMVINNEAEVSTVLGTVQDVTEKQKLIRQLKKTETIYKQAEELANMGNWSWEIKDNKLDWTDQLYRIYGLQPRSEEITIDRFLSLVHPEDRERVSRGVDEVFTKDLLDYVFRIITPAGETKILRSMAHVQRDDKGDPAFVIGVERDITEKQTLIDKLRRSENLYKQAQSLAHVGNWSWDIASNKIEWSDELYRIYGLEPQSVELSYEEYLSLTHPDDTDKVKNQVNEAYETGSSWNFTHRVIRKNGDVRVVYATGEVLKNEKDKPYMMVGTAQDITERQLMIDRLQQSEKLFKQAQSLAHLGNWTHDVTTKKFEWSDEMYKIYEVDKNDKIDFDKWVSYIHPDDLQDVLSYYDECLEKRKLYDKIHRIVLKDGKVKTIHRKGEFILDDQGKPVKMIGTTQDVTEEYRIQQALKENQTFIRKITDATPSIIASYNINSGKYVFISEGLEKLLGYQTTEVMEKGLEFFVGIIHPADAMDLMEKNRLSLEEANEDPLKNDIVIEFTYRMRHKNGNYKWFHTYGTIFDRNSAGKVEHVLNITLDITEQVTATEKIKEQEHFIQQIADSSPTILYLFDATKQSVVYINREIFFVLGYSPEEIIGQEDAITQNLYHPEDIQLLPGRKQSEKTFQQVGSMIQYECRIRNKDGEWKWFVVREIVFKADEEGHITQILGAALDISRRKEMEKTILQNSMLLEQSNSSLEEFAYVASHDLKEPLRKISTFGDRLVATQAEAMTGDGKVYLNKIIDASQRMQTMISDLLSVSMITGNTAFEMYSLQKIFEETLQTLEYKIEQQNAIIKSDELPELMIIPSQIRQLFQNLLSNSLKFVKPDTQPVIKIGYKLVSADEAVHYQLSQASHYHRLEFSDNGIGFDNEYAGKIFAIFQRLHGRSEYEGSGIGLAICKKIVEHHGGIIYAQGTEGEGARFIIILPA